MQFIHNRQAEKHLQAIERASCRYFGLKKSICNSEHQGSADTLGATRASAIVNIKAVQIHRLSKKHLRQQITRECRYTTKQGKTMQSSELESGLPDEAEQDCIVFFLLGSCLELNSKNFTVIIKTDLQFIGENVSESIYKR